MNSETFTLTINPINDTPVLGITVSFIDTVSNIIEKDGFIKSIIENKKLHRFYPKNFSYEQLVNLIINIDLLINENILDKSEFIFFDKKFKFAGLDIKTEYLSKKYIDNNKNINHSVDNYFYLSVNCDLSLLVMYIIHTYNTYVYPYPVR